MRFATRRRSGLGGFALASVLAAGLAFAHPFALSRFDAYTEGRDVRFELALDATSLLDMLKRTDLEQGDAALFPRDLKAFEPQVLAYFAARFAVRNTDLACVAAPATGYAVDEPQGKLRFSVRFRCPTELSALVIESHLFGEEDTPHDLLGNFHHVRALARVFLTRNAPLARLDVPSLPQTMPAEIDTTGGFRSAEPPPGAFDLRAREAIRGVPVGERVGARAVLGPALCLLLLLLAANRRAERAVAFTLAHGLGLALVGLGGVTVAPTVAAVLPPLALLTVAGVRRFGREAPVGLAVAGGLGLSLAAGVTGLGLAVGLGMAVAALAAGLALVLAVLEWRLPARAAEAVSFIVAGVALAWLVVSVVRPP